MMDSELEKSVRAIIERNQKTRADYSQLSARVLSLTLTGTEEEIDEFGKELEDRFSKLLEGPGENPAVGGTGSGEPPATAGSGEPPQQ
jgi:hypothetical protein